MVNSGSRVKAGCEAAELLELADPVGPIRFDTTSEPMRMKSRPKAASAIRYLKMSAEANANPCSSTASVPTPGDFEGSRPTPRKRPIALGRRFGVISPSP
jgi:hypothetical protein